MTIICLRRIDPQRNMARFYELSVQPTLFGEIAVIRHWGRLGTRGQSKEIWCRTENAATDLADKVLRAKRQRGYNAGGIIGAVEPLSTIS